MTQSVSVHGFILNGMPHHSLSYGHPNVYADRQLETYCVEEIPLEVETHSLLTVIFCFFTMRLSTFPRNLQYLRVASYSLHFLICL